MTRNRARAFISILLMSFLMILVIPASNAGPNEVGGSIDINEEWPIVPNEEGDTVMEIVGSFTLDTKTLQDSLSSVTATLSLSEGQWEASLRQTEYIIEDTDTWERFYIDLIIPTDAMVGQSSTYTVTVQFQGRFSESSAQDGFTVRVDSGTMDDDTVTTDTDSDTGGEGDLKSSTNFPLWPIFLLILIVAIVIVGIWAYRNIEIVQETDGKRKIYLREKDTGRILGRDR